jgi:hypothetical protein
MHDLLFPYFADRFRSVKIEEAAVSYAHAFPELVRKLHTHPCSKEIIEIAHRNAGAQYSFGGYMEVRRVYTDHTYHGENNLRLHLGMDYTVPKGSKIMAPADMEILYVERNPNTKDGLGTSIFAQVKGTDIVLLFSADIEVSHVKEGDFIPKGNWFSKVNLTKFGNWPHLHVQAMDRKEYDTHEADGFKTLDVYGDENDADALKKRFPSPESIELPVKTPFKKPEILASSIITYVISSQNAAMTH